MLKRLATGLLSLAVLSSPVLAQTPCNPADLAAAVDRYAKEPFSALTWRVLQGHGDPMLDQQYPGSDYWSQQDRWKKLAAEILPDASGLQNIGWNCRIGYPLNVLEKRMGSLGKEHPYVKQWLMAQEQVMRACASDSDAVAMPPPLEIDSAFANLQKLDRAYQEATIAFYRDKEKAVSLFRAIAQSTSPHRAAAAYNIANLLANAKQPDAARKEAEAILADPAMGSVHAITHELLGYIANQQDTAEGWTGIIERDVAILETPADKILADEDLKREYASALYDIDFAGVRAKDDDWWLGGTLPENPTISKALVDMSRKHPMVLWMMAGQSANQNYKMAPWSLIGTKWQDRMTDYMAKTLAVQPSASNLDGLALDMLQSLAAKPDDSTRAALWAKAKSSADAAAKSCGTAPETAAAGFLLGQATRLSAMAGKYGEAYEALAAVPFKTAAAYYDGALLHMGQYLAGEGNAQEARTLRDRLITPDVLAAIDPEQHSTERASFGSFLGLIAEDEAKWKDSLRLGADPTSNMLFNLLPTTTLWALTSDQSFAEADRALFARAAWTRDYALRRKVVDEYEDKLWSLNPEMKAIAEKAKADYPKVMGENLRLLTILRSPRHNILVSLPAGWNTQSLKPDSFTGIDSFDHNDKNWWCPLETDRQLGALRAQADAATGVPSTDAYNFDSLAAVYDEAQRAAVDKNRDSILKAHPMVKAVNWKEVAALSKMPSAPKKLTEAAIRWGKASKGGDGAPEALALAVKAARYGCNWHGGHASYSKPAQQLLQAKFKDTQWAKDTPYWFDCMRQEWDKDGNKVTTCKPATWPKQAPLK